MRLGAHVSTQGGLDKAIDRAHAMGAETIQIFGSAPQTWRRRAISDDETAAFRDKGGAAGIAPVFLHASYLISLVSDDPVAIERSGASLTADLELCSRIGASGSIVHAGSHKGLGFEAILPRATTTVRRILDATPRDSWLILENSAGMGGSVGARFAELGEIIREVGDPRVKVCLDTQHAYAMGYDLTDEKGLADAVNEFDREIGLDRLVACHANDSKVPLSGVRDRHENIGQGHIGRDGFRRIFAHPAFAEVPFILEVPGFGNQGPDKENLDILKEIRREAGATP
ncbi:MAG: deoxyribonuclease IV [Dehalococcoidia bacterium]|jgi:deoxyribonuclease-4